jgi:hypothetical protein
MRSLFLLFHPEPPLIPSGNPPAQFAQARFLKLAGDGPAPLFDGQLHGLRLLCWDPV